MTPILLDAGFDYTFVALSFVISVIGSFVALTAASGIVVGRRPLNRINLLAAAFALGGIGVWAMHFVGMLAMQVEMAIGYAIVETVASLVLAVVGSLLALTWVARNPHSVRHLLQGGVVLGLAVSAMHYLGMYGMRFSGVFEWSGGLVLVSVAIALVAATAALLLAFHVRGLAGRVVAALVMGVAVCAMHYTGMAAADFLCTSETPLAMPRGFGVISASDLPVLVTVLSLGMAFVIFVDQVFQRLEQPSARRA